MEKILITTFCILVNFGSLANLPQWHPIKQKKDTVRDLKRQPKPHTVKSRQARMRMQQQQIKFHEKQLKKVHQEELRKGLHKTDSA